MTANNLLVKSRGLLSECFAPTDIFATSRPNWESLHTSQIGKGA